MDGADGTGGCPEGPRFALRWSDRDLTHAMLPGVVLEPAPGVTRVTEERLDESLLLDLHFDAEARFSAITIQILDPGTGQVVTVFEDRLGWADGRPAHEERWGGPSADALTRFERVEFTYDEEGRRSSATLRFDDGRPGTGLSWTWSGACLVAYDRDVSDSGPGWASPATGRTGPRRWCPTARSPWRTTGRAPRRRRPVPARPGRPGAWTPAGGDLGRVSRWSARPSRTAAPTAGRPTRRGRRASGAGRPGRPGHLTTWAVFCD